MQALDFGLQGYRPEDVIPGGLSPLAGLGGTPLSSLGSYSPSSLQNIELPQQPSMPRPSYSGEQAPSLDNSAFQLSQAEVPKVPFWKALLLGLSGNPQMVGELRKRNIQSTLGQIYPELSTKFNQALYSGNFDAAQGLLAQFQKFSSLTPEAYQLAKDLTEKFNKRYDDQLEKRGTLDSMLRLTNDPHSRVLIQALRDDPRVGSTNVVEKIKLYAPSVQIADNLITTYNTLTGQTNRQAVNAPFSLKDLSPEQRNFLDMPGSPISSRDYADIVNRAKVNGLDSLTPEARAIIQIVEKGSPSNISMPESVQRQLTSKGAPVSFPQATPTEQQRQTVAGTGTMKTRTAPSGIPSARDITSRTPTEAIPSKMKDYLLKGIERDLKSGDLSPSEAQALRDEIQGTPSTSPEAPPQGSDLEQLQEQQQHYNEERIRREEEARKKAENKNTPLLSNNMTGIRRNEKGQLEARTNLSREEAADKSSGWMTTLNADREGHNFVIAAKRTQDALQRYQEVLDDPKIPDSEKSGFITVLQKTLNTGITIPFTSWKIHFPDKILTPGQQKIRDAAAGVLQTIEPGREGINPIGADSVLVGRLKNTLYGNFSSPDRAKIAIKELRDSLDARIDSLLDTYGANHYKKNKESSGEATSTSPSTIGGIQIPPSKKAPSQEPKVQKFRRLF